MSMGYNLPMKPEYRLAVSLVTREIARHLAHKIPERELQIITDKQREITQSQDELRAYVAAVSAQVL